MSLLDSISQWIDKDREQLTYSWIPQAQVDAPTATRTLTAGVHYIRLRLASMCLKKQTEWFTSWYPAVHSVVRFEFGNQVVEIPNIADEAKVAMQRTPNGNIVARNFVLTPLMPFQGGIVSLSAGLFAVQGQNYLKSVLKVLGKFSSMLSVPQLSLALNVAEPLVSGIQEIFTTASTGMHLGLHDSFSEGQLQDGYFAVVRRPAGAVKLNELFVVNDVLHQGTSLTNSQPFAAADHMLFRVELLDKRDDWEGLSSIQEPFNDALRALPDQTQATHFMRTALLRATLSPDLTAVDKRRVVDRLQEKYQQAKKMLSFSGAVETTETLKQVMRQPMSVELALGQGVPTVPEVFAFGDSENGRAMRRAVNPYDRLGKVLGTRGGQNVSGRFYVEQAFEAGRVAGTKLIDLDEPESPSAKKASFYFETIGDGVRGNRVKFGAAFDLSFNYGVNGSPLLIIVSGKELSKLVESEKAELDVIVIPRGFTLTDSKWAQRATFIDGVLQNDVVFHLKAPTEAVDGAGLNIIFETKGATLYEFFIPFEIGATLDDADDTQFEAPSFDLDDVAVARGFEQRTARLLLFADGEKLVGSFENLDTEVSFPIQTKNLTRSSLADSLAAIKEILEPVASHTIWNILDDPLGKPGNAELFEGFVEQVATAGWQLYESLASDPEFAKVLSAIESLPPGSTLSIKTDCAFLPWEILYPSDFNWKYSPEIKAQQPVQPQSFWGSRFVIECLLSGAQQTYKVPAITHKNSRPYVSLNIYPPLDEDFQGREFLPGESHEKLRAELEPLMQAELHRNEADIRHVFDAANYKPTVIYLLCHGQNDRALDPKQREKLEIDKEKFVEPAQVYVNNKYPCGPIMFLNSCSSGAFSPLAFSSFLTRFRNKNAVGLIGTSFPVPITFGSAFGQELIRRYLKDHQPIGQALYELRREQMMNGNPIGLFYTLQCPADITSFKPEEVTI